MTREDTEGWRTVWGGSHRLAQVQEIHFSSYNTMSMLQVAVLQWCKTVCVCASLCGAVFAAGAI